MKWAVVVFVAGLIAGACGLALVNALRLELMWWRYRHAHLPPASARAISRAARRNRADLRRVREAGVRLVRPTPDLKEDPRG